MWQDNHLCCEPNKVLNFKLSLLVGNFTVVIVLLDIQKTSIQKFAKQANKICFKNS